MTAKTPGDSSRGKADHSIMRPRSSGTVGDWTIVARAPRYRGPTLKEADKPFVAHVEDGEGDTLGIVRRSMKRTR